MISSPQVLLKMLPNYYDHVAEHENTLITKFFGLHRITLRGGKKVRFSRLIFLVSLYVWEGSMLICSFTGALYGHGKHVLYRITNSPSL